MTRSPWLDDKEWASTLWPKVAKKQQHMRTAEGELVCSAYHTSGSHARPDGLGHTSDIQCQCYYVITPRPRYGNLPVLVLCYMRAIVWRSFTAAAGKAPGRRGRPARPNAAERPSAGQTPAATDSENHSSAPHSQSYSDSETSDESGLSDKGATQALSDGEGRAGRKDGQRGKRGAATRAGGMRSGVRGQEDSRPGRTLTPTDVAAQPLKAPPAHASELGPVFEHAGVRVAVPDPWPERYKTTPQLISKELSSIMADALGPSPTLVPRPGQTSGYLHEPTGGLSDYGKRLLLTIKARVLSLKDKDPDAYTKVCACDLCGI